MLILFTIIGAVLGGLITWYFITPFTFPEEEEFLTDLDEEDEHKIDFTKFKWFNKE